MVNFWFTLINTTFVQKWFGYFLDDFAENFGNFLFHHLVTLLAYHPCLEVEEEAICKVSFPLERTALQTRNEVKRRQPKNWNNNILENFQESGNGRQPGVVVDDGDVVVVVVVVLDDDDAVVVVLLPAAAAAVAAYQEVVKSDFIKILAGWMAGWTSQTAWRRTCFDMTLTSFLLRKFYV